MAQIELGTSLMMYQSDKIDDVTACTRAVWSMCIRALMWAQQASQSQNKPQCSSQLNAKRHSCVKLISLQM